LEAIAANHVEL